MAAVPKITLYVDTNDAVFRTCDITYLPIFLGGLMKACGNTPPINITNKDRWIDRERRRWAETVQVPMARDRPANFPPLTLTTMRHLAALDEADGRRGGGTDKQQRLARTLDSLYHDFWVEHRETHKPGVLSPLLGRVLGADEAAKVVAAAPTEGKAALQRNTDEAFAAGAFGLPWMVCTDAAGETESFWGVDHLGQVAAFLGLLRPSRGGWRALL